MGVPIVELWGHGIRREKDVCIRLSMVYTSPVVMMDALNIHGGEKLDRAMLRCVVVTMHIVYFYECY